MIGSVTSILVTTWIAFRTPGAALYFLRHPLQVQEVHALLTGLLSANLLVLQVIFLARLPWLERAWGRTVLMRRHRRLGQWSFGLMVAHVLLFAVQRQLQDRARPGAALLRVFLLDPWMLIATIGTLVLVLVVVTSATRARRRIRYESWHLIHLWAYVGIALALPHQLVSRDFATGWTVPYWWGLYLAALGAVLWFRVGVPIVRSARHRLRVVDVRPESGGATTITMTGRCLDRLRVSAGQFFIWRFLGSSGRTRGHPYSLSAAPTADRLRITVGRTGDAGRRAAGLQIGVRVVVEGPYGSVVGDRRRHPRLLLLSAGIGITPFRSLLERLPLRPGEAVLIHRVHDSTTAVLLAEMTELARRRNVELIVLTGARRADGSWLPAGHVADDAPELQRLVPDVADRDVLICGPPEWTTAVRAATLAAGVARRDVQIEEFGW
ncbi:ferredoxin reductase family protein [Nakamurella sp. A5-74]|uniref:Ferredoxin reductase family protein n=1 Tax=Nakamurella sp. A5-74 TaxID=3158264 RepID=A0AAU8DRH8_9ACTN